MYNVNLMENFRKTLQSHNQGVTVQVMEGYKFNKIYVDYGTDNGGLKAFFMVDVANGDIYGVKSLTQVNKRRWYGTLQTVDQWNWNTLGNDPSPLAGTAAEQSVTAREQGIVASYKKRGRPRKVDALSKE